jgi:death-on-curing protein
LTGIEFLDLDDALGLVRRLGIGPVRDLGLLDSALARPRSSAFGEDAYPSLELKAAALLHSHCANHPLIDGNKRLAWLCVVIFLDLNGFATGLDDDGAFKLVWDVASGEGDLGVIAERLDLRQRD